METINNFEKPREQRYNKLKIFIDFLLLLIAFAAAYFIKRGHLHFEGTYIKFLPLYFSCWLISGLLTKKLKKDENENIGGYMVRLEPFFSSALFFIGMLSLFIYGLNWYNLSRFIVFGSLGIFLLLEILLLSGNFFPLFRARDRKAKIKRGFSAAFFLLEFLLITVSFFVVHFFKIGTIKIQENYEEVLLLIYFLWIFTGLIVHKFQVPEEKKYFRMIYPFVKSNFITLSIASVFIFGFRTGFSRLLVFGSLGIYACFEMVVISLYYLNNLRKKIDIPEIRPFAAPLISSRMNRMMQDMVEKEKGKRKKIRIGKKNSSSHLVREKLKYVYLKRFSETFQFVDRMVDLETINILKTEVIDSGNPYHVEILPPHSLEFFMNLHPLNNFRRVNRYLIEVNQKIKNQAIFVGKFEPCERRFIYFINNYPHLLANIFYFLDFIWRRVFPKLPFLKKIYFAVTKGWSRVFSMAEALGRLYFCGFEIVSLESVDNFVYFIVQKVNEPANDTNPSYGLLFKQKRVGMKGKIIYIYKMRTMHPYSEYIHKYIYTKNLLDEKGKIKDDFRITAWGRIFRRLWIDELPMLINWLKRDVKLVGIRPLSEMFFDTYPEDLKKERIQHKPGLIPPYYADMPKSIEEVWESEKNYLKKYKNHPFRTDMIYLFKALNNILFHKAKSR